MSTSASFPWFRALLVIALPAAAVVGWQRHKSGKAPWSPQKQGMKAQYALVPVRPASGSLVDGVELGGGSNAPALPPPAARAGVDTAAPEADMTASVLEALEHLSADDDPSKPAGISGSSDATIKAFTREHVAELLSTDDAVIEQAEDPGRLYFNLGRVALLHDDGGSAWELLNKADKKGSVIAAYYLASPEVYSDPSSLPALEHRLECLKKAEAGHFKPGDADLVQKLQGDLSKALDARFAHSEDPDLLAQGGVRIGVTDGDLEVMDSGELKRWMALGDTLAGSKDFRRHLFNLGRAAFAKKSFQTAQKYLGQAADLGSAGAQLYLAQLPANAQNYDGKVVALQKAAAAGFSEAAEKLEKALQERESKVFRLDGFCAPELMGDLLNGNVASLLKSGGKLDVPINENLRAGFMRPMTLVYCTALAGLLEREEPGFLVGLSAAKMMRGGTAAEGQRKLKESSAGPQMMLGGKLLPFVEVVGALNGDPKSDPNTALGMVFRGLTDEKEGFDGPLHSRVEKVEQMGAVDARKLLDYYHNGTKEPVLRIYQSIIEFINGYQ